MVLWRNALVRALRPAGLLLLAVFLLPGCESPVRTVVGAPLLPKACEAPAEVTDSVFLIGDAGAPTLAPDGSRELADPILRSLQRHVGAQARALGEERVGVVFLGDNVYWDGLPAEGHVKRRHGERVLEAQIEASAPARAVFMLGNHDWHIEGEEGWDRALEQRRFLKRFEPRVLNLPPGGCTGPYHVDFGRYLRFVFIDPIGFNHSIDHPQVHQAECSGRSVLDAFYDLAAEFDDPEGRHLALALHHPLLTAGPHGGHFGWKQHIFPLTDFWSWAWLPLPIIGSAYPISRQLGVTGTDRASEPYEAWVQAIYRASRPTVPSIYVAGHEHSLQVHRDAVGVYYLVSGSGSKKDRVVEEDDMESLMLAAARHGFMRLDTRSDGSLELEVLAVDRNGNEEQLMRHCLAEGPPGPRSR